jgi:cysteinyl-tRNA synthetase
VKNGEVFFEVGSFPEYGKLSNRKKDDLLNLEQNDNKNDAHDFSLWKPAKE